MSACSCVAARCPPSGARLVRRRASAPMLPLLHGMGKQTSRSVVTRSTRGRAGFIAVAELPSLTPKNADDALDRFRLVMTGLYAAGGLLHVPDLIGRGPICAAVGTSTFAGLSPLLRAVTVGWAVLGPAAAVGLGTKRAWGEAILVGVASTEIILGVDFADAMAPAAIPTPVVAAQVVCLLSIVTIRAWKTAEGAGDDAEKGESR